VRVWHGTGLMTGIWSAVTQGFLRIGSALLLCEVLLLAPELRSDPQRDGETTSNGKARGGNSPADHPVACLASLMNSMGSVLPGGAS
jgi:hypothetical protein